MFLARYQERLNERRADLQSLAKELEVKPDVADKSGFKLEDHEAIRDSTGKLRDAPENSRRNQQRFLLLPASK